MLYALRYASPLGEITMAERGGALCGLWLEGQKYFLLSVREEMRRGETPVLLRARDWLERYFAGDRPKSGELPLAPEGSAFRQEIWHLLCDIPYGAVTTYGALAAQAAARLGKARLSAQAVGGAVGHNPLSIIIPCHRVVGASGSLTGYAGGIDKKIWLLTHEGADMSRLYAPEKGTAL